MPNFDDILARLQQQHQALEIQQAKYGVAAPPELLTRLDDCRPAIELTEQVRAGHLTKAAWREALKPLLVKIEAYELVELIRPGSQQVARGNAIAQATHGGHAEVNTSAIDQRGQQVSGDQYNAGRRAWPTPTFCWAGSTPRRWPIPAGRSSRSAAPWSWTWATINLLAISTGAWPIAGWVMASRPCKITPKRSA